MEQNVHLFFWEVSCYNGNISPLISERSAVQCFVSMPKSPSTSATA